MKIYSVRLRLPILGMILLSFNGVCVLALADDAIPKPFPPAHFDQLAAHSPFSPPTNTGPAPTPTPPLTQKIFEKYTLISLMQQGAEYYATLNNKETSEHIRVRTNDPTKNAPDGVELASVDWANNPTETKVTLRKGTDFGVVTFDAAGAAPAAPGVNGGVRPGIPPRSPQPPMLHPPPGVAAPNPGVPAPPMPAGNNARRPAIIRSPAPTTRPLSNQGQPGINPVPAVRPTIPGAKPVAGADDDDDDN
jgi:hypothetical protein